MEDLRFIVPVIIMSIIILVVGANINENVQLETRNIESASNESHAWASSPSSIDMTNQPVSSFGTVYWYNSSSGESFTLTSGSDYTTNTNSISLTCGS